MHKEKPAPSLRHGLKFCFITAFFVLLSYYTIANIQSNIDVNAQLQDADSPSISDAQNNSSGTFMEGTNLRQDISGKYSNPGFGIINLDIPTGWYASEGMFGDKGIIIDMHPGTSEEFVNMLTTGNTNQTIPVMSLIVVDKKEMIERQSMAQETPTSFIPQCSELQPNSTATVDGKTLEVSTMRCATKDKLATQPDTENPEDIFIPDFSRTEVFKRYEYEAPNAIYILQLTLSSEYSPINKVDETEIAKFTPILDKTVETLRLTH